MRKSTEYLTLAALAVGVFTAATTLQTHTSRWTTRRESESILKVLFGEGRKLFANQFFEMADVYFHSGYYPSIFDRNRTPRDTEHLKGEHEEGHDTDHEKEADFLGKPCDWVERFGRNFMVTEHTHLQAGKEREILPWLRLSAELDPQRVETYTVAAYWLRKRLDKAREAEQFLREGLRANPNSYEILSSLGELYEENYQNPSGARNFWELALRRWSEQEPQKQRPDNVALDKIAVHLGRIEEDAGNLPAAIRYLELGKKVSPSPDALDKEIAELRRKIAAQPKPKE